MLSINKVKYSLNMAKYRVKQKVLYNFCSLKIRIDDQMWIQLLLQFKVCVSTRFVTPRYFLNRALVIGFTLFVAQIICCFDYMLLRSFVPQIICCIDQFVAQIICCLDYLLLRLFVAQIICCIDNLLHRSFVAQIICCLDHLLLRSFVAQIICCIDHLLLRSFVAQIICCLDHLLPRLRIKEFRGRI